jgi:hypothetical protein
MAIALLAHELRHVLEVADAPWVQSDDDMKKFFWNAPGAEGKADGERAPWRLRRRLKSDSV